ncbi:MAG: FMN-binding protein [Candidatus Roizmanbacteria bacterium]
MNKQVAIGILSFAIISVVVVGFYFSKGFSQSQEATPSKTVVVEVQPTNTEVPNQVIPSSNVPPQPASAYKDGTYVVSGLYTAPSGPEDMSVSVILKSGKIESTDITPKATDKKSLRYQQVFSESYKSLVIGKSLDEVKLDAISGASLTTIGFNDAIDKIKVQAKG